MLRWARRMLRSGKSSERTSAVRAAASESGPQKAAEALAALGDQYHGARRAAVRALARIGDDNIVDRLIPMLLDEHSEVRGEAREALLKLGWKPASDRDEAASSAAGGYWRACKSLGSAALEPLLVALRDSSIEEGGTRGRGEIANVLGEIGDRAAVEPLIESLRNRGVRWYAARALAKIADPRAIEPLAALLNPDTGSDQELQCVVAEALAGFGDRRALDWAWDRIGDPIYAQFPFTAARVISALGEERSVERLRPLLDHPDPWVGRHALYALAMLGEAQAIGRLVAAFGEHGEPRDANAEALLRYGELNRVLGIPPFGRISELDRSAAEALTGIEKNPEEISSADLQQFLDLKVRRVVHSWEEDPDPDVMHHFVDVVDYDCSVLRQAAAQELERRSAGARAAPVIASPPSTSQ